MSPEQARVAVQGIGNVGSIAAQILYEERLNIVALSDIKGGIYNPKGLNPDQVLSCKKESGSVIEFKGAELLYSIKIEWTQGGNKTFFWPKEKDYGRIKIVDLDRMARNLF